MPCPIVPRVDRKWAQGQAKLAYRQLLHLAEAGDRTVLEAASAVQDLLNESQEAKAEGYLNHRTRAAWFRTHFLDDWTHFSGRHGARPRHPALRLVVLCIVAEVWADRMGITRPARRAEILGRYVTSSLLRGWWTWPRATREATWSFRRASKDMWKHAKRALGRELLARTEKVARAWRNDAIVRATGCGCDRTRCDRCQRMRRDLDDYFRRQGRPLFERRKILATRTPRGPSEGDMRAQRRSRQ